MGDPLKKVQSGEKLRIPAAAYNAFVEAALAHRHRQQDRGRGGHAAGPADRTVVPVKNNSGTDAPRFGVLGIDSPLFTPADSLESFQNQPALVGVTPTSSHAGKFVILLEPLANGAIGRAVVAGLAVVKVSVTDAAHTRAEVKAADSTQLLSGTTGSVRILWKEAGTGTRWALVRLAEGSGLPAASGLYKVLMVLDDAGTVGWDFPRFGGFS